MSDLIVTEIQSLSPDAIIELFEIEVGTEVFKFHAGTNKLRTGIIFGPRTLPIEDITYHPYPIEASGFQKTGEGSLPRPILRISNLLNIIGVMSVIPGSYSDLVGSKVRRIRTFKKFLNSENFGENNPSEDVEAKFPSEYYIIERKSHESRDLVEFELAVPWDLQNVQLPRRQVLANICPFAYRSPECSYGGPPIATVKDIAIVDQITIDDAGNPWRTLTTGEGTSDSCGKRLASCKLRFNRLVTDSNGKVLNFSNDPYYTRDDILPYGGFPGAGRLLT